MSRPSYLHFIVEVPRDKGTCLRLYGKADGGARVETMGEGQEPTMLSLARVRQTNET